MPSRSVKLSAISPVDGRYQKTLAPLAAIVSEQGLMSYRVRVEVEWLIAVSLLPETSVAPLSEDVCKKLRALVPLSLESAESIKAIEEEGHGERLATRHDVKAVEYFLQDMVTDMGLNDYIPFIHFGLTSEDVNNLAYALLLRDALLTVYVPSYEALIESLTEWAKKEAGTAMLARTHGQPASPTTFGKELNVVVHRMRRQLDALCESELLVKLNGATGNYNALYVAYPGVDWPRCVASVIETLNNGRSGLRLTQNPLTTQIEPHDTYAEIFQTLIRLNTILIDFDQDIWRYISDGWVVQKKENGQVGSSTMPHKVNPIDFENSEGNAGLANALLEFFARKLPISRLQRDLSDSTVERNFGVALAHSQLAVEATRRGLAKLSLSHEAIEKALFEHPEVLAEAVQTILRREGVTDAYEQLKQLTQGKVVTLESFHEGIRALPVNEEVKIELVRLMPASYIGLAESLATTPPESPQRS